jgi:hypothetical protein
MGLWSLKGNGNRNRNMANNNSNQFKQILSAPLFGNSPSGTGSQGSESLAQLTQQLLQLQTVSQAQTEASQANTQALQQVNVQQSQSTGSSVLGSIGSALGDVLGFGFGLSPIISGIASLFGGGSSDAPAALTQYIAPGKVNVSAGVSDSFPGQAFGADYGQGNIPRPVDSSAAPVAPAPQITVQVQALDSQSFLDHSADIAAAVRQAMLESSVLNDVIAGV